MGLYLFFFSLTETVKERKGLFSLSLMAGAARNGSLQKHEALVTRNSSQDTGGLDWNHGQAGTHKGHFPVTHFFHLGYFLEGPASQKHHLEKRCSNTGA